MAIRIQAFAAYERGRLVRWGPISSGGPNAPTLGGVYHANWKARSHVSSVDSTWIMPWTVNIDDRMGTALHQYALPGRPASHCCIRLQEDDARWIFDWIVTRSEGGEGRTPVTGTTVFVFGEYDFGARPPWRCLPSDSNATTIHPNELRAGAPF